MPDDHLLIPTTSSPPPTEKRPHPVRERLDKITIGVSILALALGGIATCFSYLQWKSAETARLDAKKASEAQAKDVERSRKAAEDSATAAKDLAKGMERSARAAEISAGAGRDALALNRRALILSNEPHLEIADSRMTKALIAGETPKVTTRIRNAGKGVALKAEMRQWIHVWPKREFPYNPIDRPPSITDLGPGFVNEVSLTVEMKFAMTDELIKMINDGQLNLYVYGLAEYYDNTLDKQRKYTWRWCNFYNPGPTNADKLALSVCREHNHTTVE